MSCSLKTSVETEIEEAKNLKRRIENHIEMHRYQEIEPKYKNSQNNTTK